MKLAQLLGVVLYSGYLVHVGLLMILLPWSPVWPHLLRHLPPVLVVVADSPLVRGGISGFGALHLLLMVAELALAPRRRPG